MKSQHRSRTLRRALSVAAIGTLAAVATLSAHDFWLVPNALMFGPGASVEVLGQSGTKFPTSSGPTQATQVAEARIVGRSSDEKVTDLSVSGKSLMLRHKPRGAGQYVVAVALAGRNARTTPERLQRYIALEGAPELAARHEKDGKYPKADSVTQMTAKFAKTIVQVGDKGPRAFDKVVGHALELVPLDNPAAVSSGGTIRVRLLFHGTPVDNVHLRAGWGSPNDVHGDSPGGPVRPDQVIVTGADGVATVSITEPGLWNVRTLYASAMQGMPEHWEVYFATIVFAAGEAGGNDSGDEAMDVAAATGVYAAPSDSADAVAALARFHASLTAGDSATALSLLMPTVQIMESGGIEDLTHYRAHHLAADIAYAKATRSEQSVAQVAVHGDMAWVASTSVTTGEMNGRAVNSSGAELAVLARTPQGWKLSAVHWSSRARRSP